MFPFLHARVYFVLGKRQNRRKVNSKIEIGSLKRKTSDFKPIRFRKKCSRSYLPEDIFRLFTFR
ncbi:hypothetical protein CH375_03840 [Leptospira ellisii]|uniref:Uncharacterized protein n=1 Tax=Leptospira ellisii TaxID=2023197 RepID=A0A2N0BBR1_9LEPT|nr:hypothetical protein CH379_04945 [Leptospira ellisii]PKA05674.1 hypothetical protein CH375_03840 [Leptospira ellisii]